MNIQNDTIYLAQDDIKAVLNKMDIAYGEGRAECKFGNLTLIVTADFHEVTCEGCTSTYMGMTMTETLHDYWCDPYNIEVEAYTDDGEEYYEIDADSYYDLTCAMEKCEWDY